MKKHWVIIGLFLLVASLGLVACGGEETTGGTDTTAAAGPEGALLGEGESVTLVWATGLQETSTTYTEFVLKWADWVKTASNGRVTIEFQPAILPPPQILDGVSTGVADMGDLFMGLYAGRFPLNEVVSLPFLFDYPASRAAGLTATDLVNKYPAMEAEFTNAGVKFLGFMPMGAGQIHTTEKQVKTMADMNGLILEAHSGEAVSKALQLLGATPEQVAPAEGFDALTKGIVGGTVGEYEFIVSAGFNEAINHSTEVGTFGQGMEAVVMNLAKWEALPADIQEFLSGEAMKAYTEVMGVYMDKSDKAARDVLDAQYKAAGTDGVYALPADELAKWKTTIAPVYDTWVAAAGADGAAILADAKAFAAKYAFGKYSTEYPDQMMQLMGIVK